MSPDNVAVMRRLYECLARRDWDAMADLFDPEVEQHGTVGGLEEGVVLRGFAEIREMYERSEDVWDDHRIAPEEFIDAGDRVIVLQREYQRGKGSGLEVTIDTAVIADLRDGRIVQMRGYMDRAAALAAAGLGDASSP